MATDHRSYLPACGLLAIVLLFCDCAALPEVPVRPPPGLLVTDVEAPLTLEFRETPIGKREGRASCIYIREPFFGLSIVFGDAGIEDAAKKGYLKSISYADCEMLQVLGIVGVLTVTVHGE